MRKDERVLRKERDRTKKELVRIEKELARIEKRRENNKRNYPEEVSSKKTSIYDLLDDIPRHLGEL